MIEKSTLDFLKAIKKNNNKEWFDKNKPRYLAAKENIENFIGEVLKHISAFDKRYAGLEAKKCTYRIYRDVRFSKNKTPYKGNLGASINIGGKKVMNAGFYIHIEQGKSLIACGIWMPPADQLKKIRQEIDYNAKEFRKILANKTFKKNCGEIDKEYSLKTTPKGYPKDHSEIEFLKLTSFIAWHKFKDVDVIKKNFAKEVGKVAASMKPYIDFLNAALD